MSKLRITTNDFAKDFFLKTTAPSVPYLKVKQNGTPLGYIPLKTTANSGDWALGNGYYAEPWEQHDFQWFVDHGYIGRDAALFSEGYHYYKVSDPPEGFGKLVFPPDTSSVSGFRETPSLTDVDFSHVSPNSEVTIGARCFTSCENLANVMLARYSGFYFNEYAFYGTAITNLDIYLYYGEQYGNSTIYALPNVLRFGINCLPRNMAGIRIVDYLDIDYLTYVLYDSSDVKKGTVKLFQYPPAKNASLYNANRAYRWSIRYY